MRSYFFNVTLKCEYGLDVGRSMMGKCKIKAKSTTGAKRKIIGYVAEQNKLPLPEGVELTVAENQHISDNWSRWRVLSISMAPSEEGWPDDKDVYWDNWDKLPEPQM